MRRVRAVLLLLAAVAVLTGCYRSDIAIEVEDDGSGTFHMVAGIDREAFEQLAGLGFTDESGEGLGDDPCGEIRSELETSTTDELPPGAEVKPWEQDGFCGVEMRFDFSSTEELAQLLSDDADSTFSSFTLERDGDGWVFEAVPSTSMGEDAGGMDFSSFGELENASNIVRVKLPGRQVEHNADRIDGDGTLIWNLDIFAETRTLHARTEPGDPIRNETRTPAGEDVPGALGGDDDDGGSPVLWIGLGLLVVVAAIVGLVLWQRTRTKTPPVATAAGGAAGAAEGWGGQGSYGAPLSPPTAPTAPAPPTGAPEPLTPVEPTAGAPEAPTEPTTPTTPTAPAAPGSGPQWDPQRGAYIQWDGQRWLQYDDAAGEWKPIS